MVALVRLPALIKRVRYGLLTLGAVMAVLAAQGGLVHLALRQVAPAPQDEATRADPALPPRTFAPLRVSSELWTLSAPDTVQSTPTPRPSATPTAAPSTPKPTPSATVAAHTDAAPQQTAARVDATDPPVVAVPVEAPQPEDPASPDGAPVPWGHGFGDEWGLGGGRDCPQGRVQPAVAPRGYHCGWDEQPGHGAGRGGNARSGGTARPDR